MDYEKLYKAYYLQVYSYTISLAKNREIAEEITQNTFYKAVSTTSQFKGKSKEYQLVELLAKYPDKVFSKQNLYESIWQEPFARDNDVINTHISNLRKKLKGEGCRIKTIWGLGYRFAK